MKSSFICEYDAKQSTQLLMRTVEDFSAKGSFIQMAVKSPINCEAGEENPVNVITVL